MSVCCRLFSDYLSGLSWLSWTLTWTWTRTSISEHWQHTVPHNLCTARAYQSTNAYVELSTTGRTLGGRGISRLLQCFIYMARLTPCRDYIHNPCCGCSANADLPHLRS
ncbi:hypothetical protein ASPVEDRAFT_807411 [Aspergillus versicolor CBS 583.65]|uniref:Uncharacterized protein n=1 Tax=Aspergillus versicolor CBS 583.65 TaxID=1036611 RepID=A0A1L9PTB2_ASPVE|nr:uncharacterized protein ASPVEDRAFT_807411 [Aspergillus versicolor CBS 583.65]OJJ04665.1 hypothetical protein ASPVEDRAFT_807411 [Aspergillus versicolor CBS 583.65]